MSLSQILLSTFLCNWIFIPSWNREDIQERTSHWISNNNIIHAQIYYDSKKECYRWKYRSSEKQLNFRKLQLKRKIVKHFMSPKQRAVIRKLFSSPPNPLSADKIWLCLWNKNLFTEIYKSIQTFAFKVLQECGSWASRNREVQMSFLTPNRNLFAGIFVKSERFLAVLREYIAFNINWVEIRKMSEVFWVKLYCKMSEFFC